MDFLTFKRFISIDVLIAFYYLGAIVLPVAAWFFGLWFIRKYNGARLLYQQAVVKVWQALSQKQKVALVAFFIISLLMMEVFWRMLIEFLVAYMQMRDALVQH